MAYPAPFHRIVILGTIYTDIFNTSVSMIPGISGSLPAATQTLADSVRTFVATWWGRSLGGSPAGPSMITNAKFTGVKVNRIGTNGKYVDAVAISSMESTPVFGTNSGVYAAQNATVGTLRGASPRALAGKGRQFWPPNATMQSLGSDGRISTTTANQFADALEALYAGLNDVYLAAGINSVVGIASNTRTGAFQALTDITVGRTIDTVRSRRNKIPEDPQVEHFG